MSEVNANEPCGEFVIDVKDLKGGDKVWYRRNTSSQWVCITVDEVYSNCVVSFTEPHHTTIHQFTCDKRRVARGIRPTKDVSHVAPKPDMTAEVIDKLREVNPDRYYLANTEDWHTFAAEMIELCRRDIVSPATPAVTPEVIEVIDRIATSRVAELKSQLTNAQSDISRISAEKVALEKELANHKIGGALTDALARGDAAELEVKRLTEAYAKLISCERDYQKLRSEHGHCTVRMINQSNEIAELKAKIARIKAASS